MNPLIVNVALTGCLFSKEDSEHLPVTIEEIATDAKRCYDAGASIFHVHAREKRNHKPTWRSAVYAELLGRLRYYLPADAILCVSTSGRHWGEYEKRAAVLDLAAIDMASLTMGTVDFPDGPSVTSPETLKKLAARMYERGITPELEVFDIDQLYQLRALYVTGWLKNPLYVHLFFGEKAGIKSFPSAFWRAVDLLPRGCTWGATGLGHCQFEVNCWAVSIGGHVRVGLEDSLWMGKGVKATNVAQVERIVKVGRSMGREPATAKEARAMIWQE